MQSKQFISIFYKYYVRNDIVKLTIIRKLGTLNSRLRTTFRRR